MAITSTGLATGMNINGVVQQLVNAEGQAAKGLLDRQQARVDTRLSGLGKLKGVLSSFQTALKKLEALDTFSARKTTLSNDSALALQADRTAAVGSYSIEVLNLARAEKMVSSGLASASTVVGTGTLTLGVGGNSFSVTIDASNNTLAGIRDAINNASGNIGVSATIVNADDGSGGTVSKLVLTAKETGTANALSVSISDDDGNNADASGLSGLAMTQLVAAQDAVIRVDGQTVTRSSNTISDAVSGLTFNLKAVTTSPVTAQVSADSEEVVKALQGFVDSYNSLRQVMSDLGRYDPATKKAAELTGDATLRNLQQQLRRDLTSNVSSVSGGVDSLAGIGIEIDRYGAMKLNSAKLSEAMNGNPAVVSDLFRSADGVATRTNAKIDEYLKSGGILDTQTRSMNDQKRQIADRRAALDARLSKVEEQYLKQFNKMDQIVAGYQSTGNYLAAQLAGLLK
ncbi:flagellar filament capping protein FliD [Thiofaba sp. EF100]|jgi:flagellar hook-associated protein 2|uniref:flagellar filament capping protein FliD n=1 Tax=Thiofaba sp. EF100 TaxID=3121274 RepID=UPI003221ACBC